MTAPLTGISSMATREVLAELTRAYEVGHGVVARIEPVGGVDAARCVRAGERFDVVVLASGVIAALEREGLLVAGSRVDVVRSGMAVAARAGGSRPDISDEAGLKAAILAARTVGYSTGPSGDHLLGLLRGWGVEDEMAGRMVQARPGIPVASLVAQGEADLGFQQLSELLGKPGVEVLGPLPEPVQATTVFSAGVAATSEQAEAARALLAYLASPSTAEVKRRFGMEPA